MGFIFFNFRLDIFGDTGAYLIGFVLAWLGVALVQTTVRHGLVAGPAVLLAAGGVLFAVIRRLLRPQPVRP